MRARPWFTGFATRGGLVSQPVHRPDSPIEFLQGNQQEFPDGEIGGREARYIAGAARRREGGAEIGQDRAARQQRAGGHLVSR